MSTTYTLSELAERVAGTAAPEAVATASRRIEHWYSSGLFASAKVDVGPKHLGRGRVRRYPQEAIAWARLWSAMAEYELGVVAMAQATMAIKLKMLRNPTKAMLEEAMRGEGPATFLLLPSSGARDVDVQPFAIARAPIQLSDQFLGGWVLNLTAIFTQ